jgi:proteasome accessory factor A
MGIETEYGISVPGHPHINSMLTSSQVVNAYAGLTGLDRASKASWVYTDESPLRDARGFDLSRSDADPSQLTDDDYGLANLILTNGARFYVDHAHPEYSTPEVTNPHDAVLWDRAGMVIMQQAASAASAQPGSLPIQLYKNNTDNKGSSYGCHENYLMQRRTPFAEIVRTLTPFFITRQIMSGSGRVGLGQEGRKHGYQLSQRADFFEVEVGLETTLKRPIINTRDEPHADPEFHRRLHVIVGDANLSEFATFLKMGTTALVLTLIEDGVALPDIMPEKPVAAMHAVSHDVSLTQAFTLRSGRRVTALQLQWEFYAAASQHCHDKYGTAMDEQTREVLDSWESLLTDLESDPFSAADRVDWVAKLSLLEGYRRRDNLDWSSPRLQLVDLQYSDIRPERGLALLLEARGSLRRLTNSESVEHAVGRAPEDTRAYFRGECMRRFTDSIAAASWDSVIFDVEGCDSLQRVPTSDPLKGTRAHVGHLLDQAQSARELIHLLRG